MMLRTEVVLKSGRWEGPLAIRMEKKQCLLVGRKRKKKKKTEVQLFKGAKTVIPAVVIHQNHRLSQSPFKRSFQKFADLRWGLRHSCLFFYISTWFWHVNLEWKILARLSKDMSQGEEVLLGKCRVGKGGHGTCQHSTQMASSLSSYIPVSKWPQSQWAESEKKGLLHRQEQYPGLEGIGCWPKLPHFPPTL